MPQQHTPNHARRRSTKKGNEKINGLHFSLILWKKAAQKTTAANR